MIAFVACAPYPAECLYEHLSGMQKHNMFLHIMLQKAMEGLC